MDSLASSSGCVGAEKVVTDQVLKPNGRYFIPFDCDNFSLPDRATLKAGDTFELIRTLEPKTIIMNIPSGLYFDKTEAFDGSYPWNATESSGARQTLKIIYNGLDFQLEEYSAQASIKAVRGGVVEYTSSSTFTVPIGVNQLKVTAVGGGGGAGGGACAQVDPGSGMYGQSGSGAGAGAVVKNALIDVVAGEQISIIVGAGGLGGRGGRAGYLDPGVQGADGGQTSIGTYLVVGGGKRGLGGDYGSGSAFKESPEKAGGLGGQIVTGENLGEYYQGGAGGYSGRGSTVSGNETKGGNGESVNGFLGGVARPAVSRNGSAGGGGASAVANGANGENYHVNTDASGYGAGGAGGQGLAYNSGASDGGDGGNGGNGYVSIEWSRT